VPGPGGETIAGVGPDFGFEAYSATGWYPPDCELAAGPEHVVVVVNGGVRFYTHDGVQTYSDSLSGFWAPLGATWFVFDPVALYDVLSQRFIVAAAEYDYDTEVSFLCVAISDDDDPNGTWHKYRFDLEEIGGIGGFLDYENLGVGPEAIYVSGYYFSGPGNTIHVIDKAPMLNGEPTSFKWLHTTSSSPLAAIKHYDNSAPAQYFSTSGTVLVGRIILEAVTDPLGVPQRTKTSLEVPSFQSAPPFEQKGTSNLMWVGDHIKSGIYRNGSLWLTHPVGEDDTSRTRWYEVQMNGWPESGQNPVLAQSGTLDYGPGIHQFEPDIAADDQGNAVIVFNRSSVDEYISVARAVRRYTDPPGTFREMAFMQESTTPETGDRWGDYSGIDEDPAHPGVFWSHAEYRYGSWKSWCGRTDTARSMEITGGPFISGRVVELTATGALSGGTVHFIYSLIGEGETYIPPLDVTSGLENPQLIGSTVADELGTAVLTFTVPDAGNNARLVWIEVVETGNASNVVLTQYSHN